MSEKIKYLLLAAFFFAINTHCLYSQQDKKTEDTKQKAKVESSVKKSVVETDTKAENKNAQEELKKNVTVIGFLDENKDGINDLFRDANGDGINDVNGQPYAHGFKFADKNNDKINDLFIDEDGDGVNDLKAKFEDLDGDGICDNIIDVNKDFINDITGLRFSQKSLRGYKFGLIKEERLLFMGGFIDEDMDGIPDFRSNNSSPGLSGNRDIFIDRDNDGIDDRRESQQRLRNRLMRGKQ